MMANNEKNEEFETFKAGLLKWKNEHREEYNEFARHILCNGMEYGIALTKQFPDVKELRSSDHSIRQAVGKLAGKETQMLIKDGKPQMCRYIESDEYQKLLGLLQNDLCRFA